MNRRQLAIAGLAAVAFVPLSVACSENAGESVVPDLATQQAGGTIVIEARDFSFVPELAEADSASVTIELRNTGAEPHSLTVYTDDRYETAVEGAVIEAIDPGETETISFEATGAETYNFRCEVHPDLMNGELSVGGSDSPSDETPSGATPGATPEEED